MYHVFCLWEIVIDLQVINRKSQYYKKDVNRDIIVWDSRNLNCVHALKCVVYLNSYVHDIITNPHEVQCQRNLSYLSFSFFTIPSEFIRSFYKTDDQFLSQFQIFPVHQPFFMYFINQPELYLPQNRPTMIKTKFYVFLDFVVCNSPPSFSPKLNIFSLVGVF